MAGPPSDRFASLCSLFLASTNHISFSEGNHNLMNDKLILVAGGGGFIGGHLVGFLRDQGFKRIRSVDVKPLDQWYQVFDDVENVQADLKLRDACQKACRGVSEVYNLAADMGGMGFIENNKALCMLSVLINTHLLQAALEIGRAHV